MAGGSAQGDGPSQSQQLAQAYGVDASVVEQLQKQEGWQRALTLIASSFAPPGQQQQLMAQGLQSGGIEGKLGEIAKLRQMSLQQQQRQQIEASLPQISQQTGVPIEQLRYMNASGNLGSVLQDRSKAPDPYTLSEGQQRYGGNNQLLAQNVQQKPIAPQWSDGQLVGGFNPNTNQFVTPEALGAPVPGPAARPPTEEERKAFGITGPAYFNRAGEPKGIGGGTTVNVDTKGAGAFATKAAEIQANRYGEMARAADDAVPMLSDIDAMGSLMNGMQTGKTAEARLGLAQYAKAWGMDDIANGLTDGKLGEMEAFRALTNKMIPRMRVPGSGTTSDRDAMSFQNSIPQLLNTPDGNRIVMGTFRSMYDYQMQAGDIAKRALRGEITQEQADGALRQMPSPFQLFNEYQKVASPGAGGPVRVQTPEEARRLPKGTPIILPDGRTATVP